MKPNRLALPYLLILIVAQPTVAQPASVVHEVTGVVVEGSTERGATLRAPAPERPARLFARRAGDAQFVTTGGQPGAVIVPTGGSTAFVLDGVSSDVTLIDVESRAIVGLIEIDNLLPVQMLANADRDSIYVVGLVEYDAPASGCGGVSVVSGRTNRMVVISVDDQSIARELSIPTARSVVLAESRDRFFVSHNRTGDDRLYEYDLVTGDFVDSSDPCDQLGCDESGLTDKLGYSDGTVFANAQLTYPDRFETQLLTFDVDSQIWAIAEVPDGTRYISNHLLPEQDRILVNLAPPIDVGGVEEGMVIRDLPALSDVGRTEYPFALRDVIPLEDMNEWIALAWRFFPEDKSVRLDMSSGAVLEEIRDLRGIQAMRSSLDAGGIYFMEWGSPHDSRTSQTFPEPYDLRRYDLDTGMVDLIVETPTAYDCTTYRAMDMTSDGRFIVASNPQDGTVLIHEILQSTASSTAPESLSAWEVGPNPTPGPLYIRSVDGAPSPVDISIYDALGRNVLSAISEKPVTNLSLDVSGLPVGVYFLHAVSSSGRQILTVTVLR